jgi:hypothetical protein
MTAIDLKEVMKSLKKARETGESKEYLKKLGYTDSMIAEVDEEIRGGTNCTYP